MEDRFLTTSFLLLFSPLLGLEMMSEAVAAAAVDAAAVDAAAAAS
jgi:hypothetical protein